MKVLYVNAYGVTRHFSGPEEGGSYHNSGEPLASVPVRAEVRQGCEPGTCNRCDDTRKGVQGASFCEEEKSNEDVEDAFHEWLVQDAKGEVDLSLLRQAFKGRRNVPHADRLLQPFFEHYLYRQACRTVTHVVPADPSKVETVKAMLTETLGHIEHGNIYSVLGGEKLEIYVEGAMAEAWSDYQPYS